MIQRSAIVTFDETRGASDLVLGIGQNLKLDVQTFQALYGELTSLEYDLLVVAASIFASDLAFKRGLREDFCRSVRLVIPVVNVQKFEQNRSRLLKILFLLSQDHWEIEFVQKEGVVEKEQAWPVAEGQALLFSGGLDSFAAAVKILDCQPARNLLLASHQTSNPVVVNGQRKLHSYLEKQAQYPIKRLVVRAITKRATGWTFPKATEETQRTRSFLFCSIAAVGARREGYQNLLCVGENGQMAIHLPLSAARIGAFSTHTAHPAFLAEMQLFLCNILGVDFRVENPFLYHTKPEVVQILQASYSDVLHESVSCWRRVISGLNHCGGCVPCLIRRISLEYNGIFLAEYESDSFQLDLKALPADSDLKRNTIDLIEQVHTFSTLSDAELLDQLPELYSPHFNRTDAIEMYRRFAVQAKSVFQRYPQMQNLVA